MSRRLFNLAIPLLILFSLGTPADCSPSQAQSASHSLSWIEHVLKTGVFSSTWSPAFNLPGSEQPDDEYFALDSSARDRCEAIEEDCDRLIAKYGPSERAYDDLAACQMRLGNYEPALRSYVVALAMCPHDTNALKGRREAVLAEAVAQWAAKHDHNRRVVQLEPFPVPGETRRWAVLTTVWDYSCCYLSLVERARSGLRFTWTSRSLPAESGHFFLVVRDIAGIGVPQVCVFEELSAGDVMPEHLDVFAWRAGRMERILILSSNWPVWMDDLTHDGRFEIGDRNEIGETMDHSSQPIWTDVYAYSKGRYRLADSSFPDFYRGCPPALLEVSREHADDPDILRHLGETYTILGERRKALSAYNLAVRASEARLKSEELADCIPYDEAELVSIKQERNRYQFWKEAYR